MRRNSTTCMGCWMSSTTQRLPPTRAFQRLNVSSRNTPLSLRCKEPRTAPTLTRYRQVRYHHLRASPRVALTYRSNSAALTWMGKHWRTCYRSCTFFKFFLSPALPAAMKRLFNPCRVQGELSTTASHQDNG